MDMHAEYQLSGALLMQTASNTEGTMPCVIHTRTAMPRYLVSAYAAP